MNRRSLFALWPFPMLGQLPRRPSEARSFADRVVAVIEKRMKQRIAYANSPQAGFNSEHLKRYQFSGFISPEAQCLAQDDDYKLMTSILEDARKMGR